MYVQGGLTCDVDTSCNLPNVDKVYAFAEVDTNCLFVAIDSNFTFELPNDVVYFQCLSLTCCGVYLYAPFLNRECEVARFVDCAYCCSGTFRIA